MKAVGYDCNQAVLVVWPTDQIDLGVGGLRFWKKTLMLDLGHLLGLVDKKVRTFISNLSSDKALSSNSLLCNNHYFRWFFNYWRV